MRRSRNIGTILYGISIVFILSFDICFSQRHFETGFLDRSVNVAGITYLYQVYIPRTYKPTQKWPVILFLHGSGESGSDGLLQTQVGLGPAIQMHPSRYPTIVIFPQAPKDSNWVGTTARVAMATLDETMKEFQVDSNRIYLTGLSIGGHGTWYLAYRFPSTFAAIAPICGWITPFSQWTLGGERVVPGDTLTPFQNLAHRISNVPIWIFHGEEDDVVPVDQSRQAAAALAAVSNCVQYMELLGTQHDAWSAAYGSSKFTDWLFAQRRK